MATGGSFRDVLMLRSWWLKRDNTAPNKKATHLLLDGGRAHVPDDAHGQFLNEYVLAVAKGCQPAVVELRTPIFRLFMDIDARVPLGATVDFETIWKHIRDASKEFFAEASDLVICTAPVKQEPEAVKHGAHLVWPSIYADGETALAFREKLIPTLREAFGDALFVNSWEDICDACVYRANGLRMPWSSKGKGEARPYVPTAVVGDDGIEPVPEIRGVSALRQWIHDLSIRAHGKLLTPLREGIEIPRHSKSSGGQTTGTRQRLEAYCHVLPKIDAALPEEYRPQTFTGLFRTPYSVMLRSTSHFCRNLGRAHKSNTVYFVVNRSGVAQRCFCRCETTEGRQFGMCKDYESDTFPVDQEVIDAILGPAAASATPAAVEIATLPSQKSASASKLDALLSLGVKSRAPKKRRGRK